MHFIIEQIRGNLKWTELFGQYIDDIFLIHSDLVTLNLYKQL